MINKANNSGISFFGLLTVVFIVLKLTHIITWSWWLVLLPIYIGIVVILLILLATFIYLKFLDRR